MRETFALVIENAEAVFDPPWATVADALAKISEQHAWIMLDGGDYVQTLGRPDSLIVEWCTDPEWGARIHYVLGRRGCSIGEVTTVSGSRTEDKGVLIQPVFRREVLDLTDALIIFESFYRSFKIPEAYVLRDITKNNSAIEQFKREHP